MLTALIIAVILLFVSVIIFSYAAVILLGKILVYGAVVVALACLLKWIFD